MWLEIARSLRRDFFLIAKVTSGCTVLAIALSLLWPKTYTATASFVAESPPDLASAGGVGALVARTGLFGANLGEQSPEFYASLLMGREVLESVLQLPVGASHPTGDSTQLVLDYLKVRGEG